MGQYGWKAQGVYLAMQRKIPGEGRKGLRKQAYRRWGFGPSIINTFNALIENKDYFLDKWKQHLQSDNPLQKYKAAQFLKIVADAEPIQKFDINLYFTLVEKMTVFKGNQIIVSLLDGTQIECEME